MSSAQPLPHSQDPRLLLAQEWLSTVSTYRPASIAPASADASFRRYFRIQSESAGHTAILMDAPPDREPIGPFLRVGQILRDAGLRAPKVYAQDERLGFLLLEDFGQKTFLQELQASDLEMRNIAQARDLYARAWQHLVAAQAYSLKAPEVIQLLPPYDTDRLNQELALFPDWYLGQHLKILLSNKEQQALQRVFEFLVSSVLSQSQAFVHRDYHSRNLMVLEHEQALGILDFQDAVIGPVTYDLVSLLRDAYVEWPEAVQIDWAIRYWQEARAAGLSLPDDFGVFYKDFELMGLQRHLKVLGIFARLSIRDAKHGYLHDIPRVLAYAQKVAERYAELAPLAALLQKASGTVVETRYGF